MLRKSEVYDVVIHSFQRLYSVYSYKILALSPVLYTLSVELIYFICSSLYLLILYLYLAKREFLETKMY